MWLGFASVHQQKLCLSLEVATVRNKKASSALSFDPLVFWMRKSPEDEAIGGSGAFSWKNPVFLYHCVEQIACQILIKLLI